MFCRVNVNFLQTQVHIFLLCFSVLPTIYESILDSTTTTVCVFIYTYELVVKMDIDSDESLDSKLSTDRKQSKINKQLNDAKWALKEIKTLIDPKSKRDAQFSAYHEYILWLIRNNFVRGKSDINAFVAGLIYRLFCRNEEALPLSIVGEHFRISTSTMLKFARKYTPAFQTLYWNKHVRSKNRKKISINLDKNMLLNFVHIIGF